MKKFISEDEKMKARQTSHIEMPQCHPHLGSRIFDVVEVVST